MDLAMQNLSKEDLALEGKELTKETLESLIFGSDVSSNSEDKSFN
jgi:hypothetical protein